MSQSTKEQSYRVRPLLSEEIPLLEDFLYEAIFVPPGEEVPGREILQKPSVHAYVEAFGRPGDLCLVAEIGGSPGGAAWARYYDGNLEGHGHVDDDTPEITIALHEEWRGRGIGRKLLEGLLASLKEQGCSQASLSVNRLNYQAEALYRALGFQVVREDEKAYCMVRSLK